MAQNIYDGFDHTQHKEEVEQRWGAESYAKGDQWWRGLEAREQQEWQQRVTELSNDWAEAASRSEDPQSVHAQELARRHVAWLKSVPGAPTSEAEQLKQYVLGLGEMYVTDERFAANYGGVRGATFVRDALRYYVETMP